MKLRLLVALLLVANVLMGLWQLGWLDSLLGSQSRTEREPSRVLQQVRPQAMVVTPVPKSSAPIGPVAPNAEAPAGAASGNAPSAGVSGAASAALGNASGVAANGAAQTAAQTTASPATLANCLDAGPFNLAQIEVAERSMSGVPASAWRRITTDRPAAFAVVMGPFRTVEALKTKATELERMKLKFDRITQPQADGTPTPNGSTLFVLARAQTKTAAEAALTALGVRGVRTARVATLNPASTTYRLRAEGLNESQAQALRALGTGVEGKPFTGCAAG